MLYADGIHDDTLALQAMLDHGQETILITRLEQAAADEISAVLPLTYHTLGRVGIVGHGDVLDYANLRPRANMHARKSAVSNAIDYQ